MVGGLGRELASDCRLRASGSSLKTWAKLGSFRSCFFSFLAMHSSPTTFSLCLCHQLVTPESTRNDQTHILSNSVDASASVGCRSAKSVCELGRENQLDHLRSPRDGRTCAIDRERRVSAKRSTATHWAHPEETTPNQKGDDCDGRRRANEHQKKQEDLLPQSESIEQDGIEPCRGHGSAKSRVSLRIDFGEAPLG